MRENILKIALLANRNINKVITIVDCIADYKDYLFCPTPECNCKLIYVNSSLHEPYFRSHRNHNHVNNCPYIINSYNQPVKNITCSINECFQLANYEVYLYDYYAPPINQEFMEPDFTCPYICEHHMNVNEKNAIGKKAPRSSVTYPYSNRNKAQGYTKYVPINKSSIILDPTNYQNNKEINIEIVNANFQLIKYLALNPKMLREIDPRKFEEIVAEIFSKRGFSVTLTPRTRDGALILEI